MQNLLSQRADGEYRAGLLRVAPTSLAVYGVRMPDLEELARDWQAAHPQVSDAELLALVEALSTAGSRDEQLLGLELLLRYPKRIPGLAWALFDGWRRGIDSWPVCDLLATKVFGPWVMAQPPDRLPYLELLIGDADVWSRRLALVATVPINRRANTAVPALTLDLVDRTAHERDPMISKAISWALRELTKTHPDAVDAFVASHRGALPAHVLREVNNKLTTGKKS